jgi:hypothetical protein
MDMNVQEQVVRFLRTHPSIGAVNFCFQGQKIWPDAYRRDVAAAVARGAIKQGHSPDPDAAATYRPEQDRLEIKGSFSFSSLKDLGLLLHESTHAITDMRAIGLHSGHRDEAVAYVAQAFFLTNARGNAKTFPEQLRPDLPNGDSGAAIYYEAARIAAKAIRNRSYVIPNDDAQRLVRLVASNKHYKDKVTYVSNRFKRSLWEDTLRVAVPLFF